MVDFCMLCLLSHEFIVDWMECFGHVTGLSPKLHGLMKWLGVTNQ